MSEISSDWKLNQTGRREWEISTAVDGRQEGFCDIFNNEDDEVFSDDQLEEFATLLVSAPKLLAACKKAIEFWYSDHPNDTVEAQAAKKFIEDAINEAESNESAS